MTPRPVHWHEGLFLRPHHFQAAGRHAAGLVAQAARHADPYCWGFRHCTLDPDALAGSRLVIRELEARFRDGTTLVLPDDVPPPDLDLKTVLAGRNSTTVYLAVPKWRAAAANLTSPTTTTPVQYRAETVPVEDENTGANPQPLVFRVPNVRLLVDGEDQSGYEVLPLARVEKADRAEAVPRLATGFVPPLLACDAWPGLQAEVLQELYFRLNRKIDVLAGVVKSRGVAFATTIDADARRLHKLVRMNEAAGVLGQVAFAPGVRPWAAYLELVRVVGQLAVLGPTFRVPELPRYDHDDLGGCFGAVQRQIHALLEGDDPTYEERPFVGTGLRMQVSLEPAWLETAWQMFIGVRANVTADECIKLITRPEKLGMKIGSADRVDLIFTRGQEGLRFKPAPTPPTALPKADGLTYFEVSRDSSSGEWGQVQNSLSLAIRIQERDVVGKIDGQQQLAIRTGPSTTTFQFVLYLVPNR